MRGGRREVSRLGRRGTRAGRAASRCQPCILLLTHPFPRPPRPVSVHCRAVSPFSHLSLVPGMQWCLEAVKGQDLDLSFPTRRGPETPYSPKPGDRPAYHRRPLFGPRRKVHSMAARPVVNPGSDSGPVLREEEEEGAGSTRGRLTGRAGTPSSLAPAQDLGL